MKIFQRLEEYDYEQLVFCQEKTIGLKTIIAIHDTTLGPAIGGCRMWDYPSESAAIDDALRLARGMTYKAAAARLNLGGGKAVIMGDPKKDKSEALFRAFGRFIETLSGRYITAEDVGTTVEDMGIVRSETDHVTGLSTYRGGSGDPSLVTAFGIYHGMKACIKEVFGHDGFHKRTIAIQGCGHVGYHLCENLAKEEATLIVTDIDKKAAQRCIKEFGATFVDPEEIYDVQCDIFSPCALGGILNDETIPRLKCKIIAGSANNQLKEDEHGDLLHKMRILYAPDYVINAGGLINVADELLGGYNRNRALAKAAGIYESIDNIIKISKEDGIPTHEAADRMAERRIEKIRGLSSIYKPKPHAHKEVPVL